MRSKLLLAFVVSLFSCAATSSQVKTEKLKQDNVIVLEVTTFDDENIEALIKKLKELDNTDTKIYLRLNSDGGSISGGMQLIQAIEDMKHKVSCVSSWRSFSMAAYMFESPACSERLVDRYSLVLFHEALTLNAAGNVHDLANTNASLAAYTRMLSLMAADRMGIPIEDFLEKIKDKIWIMTSDQLLKNKGADKIIDISTLPAPTPLEISHPSLLELLSR